MMERKLCLKIFASLLLVLSALASDDNETSLGGTVAPESPAAPGSDLVAETVTSRPESGSSLKESGQVSASNNNTETSHSSSLNSTTEEEEIPLTTANTSNRTSTTTSSEFINGTTSVPTLEKQNSTTELTATSTATLSPPIKPETSPMTTTPSPLESINTTQSNVSIHTDNNTATSKPTESTSYPVTTTTSASTTTSVCTLQERTTKTKTITSTTHLEVPSESSMATHKASQLNVGEDTSVVHETPALDPLLAGLVSAFIITAVIITLLLFLKLRRRDSRPEFRRLQDLPMDDMMEDTPLSMYNY